MFYFYQDLYFFRLPIFINKENLNTEGKMMNHTEHDKNDALASEEEIVNEVAAEVQAEELELSVEDLHAKIAELQGQLEDEKLRGLANEQNLRRRHEEDIKSAHKFATQKFATDLLAVKDYLEMALMDTSGQFEGLKMGVSMTLTELEKAFERGQIKEITVTTGEKMDPHTHQALQTVESEQEPNTVVAVLKKGYQLADRVIRPSMVSVAKAKEEA